MNDIIMVYMLCTFFHFFPNNRSSGRASDEDQPPMPLLETLLQAPPPQHKHKHQQQPQQQPRVALAAAAANTASASSPQTAVVVQGVPDRHGRPWGRALGRQEEVEVAAVEVRRKGERRRWP